MTAIKEKLVSLESKTPRVSISPTLMLPSLAWPSRRLILALRVVFKRSCALTIPFFTSMKSLTFRLLFSIWRALDTMKYLSRRCSCESMSFLWLSSST